MVLDVSLIISLFICFVIVDIVFAFIRTIKHRKAVDAAYKRGLADAKQASKEVINDIKIKVSEGKPFHVAANEIANEMKRMLEERKEVIK